ncbi:cytochrome P450 monooxygenase [Lentithecium fluviatile CBS 122367]|uniref:Cytochrome P450 monooxygenase n=1 Tax=Lentithecium fluviatile CBS 122367 TaxID=1168545 RepID=A0A6G1JBJ0_9PLEO|nr:cytochrome P450 monooxygenase [Lentithecium fluviatile CBS 122367]
MELHFLAGSILIVLTVHALFVLVRTVTLAFNPDLSKIPGPFLSTFSNIPMKTAILSGRRTTYIHALHEKYGPYVRIAPSEVAIADLEAYRIIHRVGLDFNKAPWYQGQVPSQYNDETCGVFGILNNKTASYRRRLFQTAGTRRIVAEREPQIHGFSDVMKWWTFMASDVTGSLAFGESFGNTRTGERNELVRDIESMMPFVGMRAELPWTKPLMDTIPAWCFGSLNSMWTCVQEYGKDAVRATRAAQQGGSKTLFSKMMLEDETEQMIPDSLIEKEASNIIVAGTDTTAMTLTYLTYAVLRQEMVKPKLIVEVNAHSERPTWEELEKMPYLNNVIQETMRLYPAIPGSLPRIVPIGGEKVAKYVIPTGTQVSTQAWTFQRDPEVFESPLRFLSRFNPDRWDNATPEMKEHMMVFGGPTRMCLGQNIARLELLHAVSKLFRECVNITLDPSTTEESMEMVDYFAIKPKAAKCLVVRG